MVEYLTSQRKPQSLKYKILGIPKRIEEVADLLQKQNRCAFINVRDVNLFVGSGHRAYIDLQTRVGPKEFSLFERMVLGGDYSEQLYASSSAQVAAEVAEIYLRKQGIRTVISHC